MIVALGHDQRQHVRDQVAHADHGRRRTWPRTSTRIVLVKFDSLFNKQKSNRWAALVGAKVGAKVHSDLAAQGDNQPALSLVGGTLGDMRLCAATGWS